MRATVAETIHARFADLTPSERKLAESLLENYPVSAVGSITLIAENAGVSTPTVARMVQKLGFRGYADFQTRLHQELEVSLAGPVTRHERWASNAPGLHILNRFAEAVTGNLRDTLTGLDPAGFDAAAALLADHRRTVYCVGGRITGAIAEYLFTHMQVIRPRVSLMSAHSSSWPQYALNMKAGDVLVIFDIRRYESDLVTLAQIAREVGVKIILFTDPWESPVARHADQCFRVRVEVPSAWDSSVVTLFVVESLIAAVQSLSWGETRERMLSLETLFGRTRLFRKSDG